MSPKPIQCNIFVNLFAVVTSPSHRCFFSPLAHPQASSSEEQLQRLLVGGVSEVISRTLIAPLKQRRAESQDALKKLCSNLFIYRAFRQLLCI